jgi:hypothetical protein
LAENQSPAYPFMATKEQIGNSRALLFFFPKKEKKSIWKMGCIGTCGMWVLQQKIQNENNNVEV